MSVLEWGLVWKIVEKPLSLIGGSLYDRYLRYRIRRDIRHGTDQKIHILLCRLADDATDTYRTTIYDTIRDELGNAVQLTNWPDVQVLGDGYEYDIERRAYERVQGLLKEHNCDLMISGRVKGQGKDGAVLSLRFTVADTANRSPETYKLTDTFDLPAAFVGHLGAAIAARVILSAAPAIDMAGQYIVPAMRTTATRMGPLVRRLNPTFGPDTRGSLLFNYALVLGIIGEQAGTNDDLAASIAAHRAALEERTRQRAPLDWAMTQNNLGATLQRLGERESGTAHLEDAVEAYRAALKVFQEAQASFYVKHTQSNLVRADALLAERRSRPN